MAATEIGSELPGMDFLYSYYLWAKDWLANPKLLEIDLSLFENVIYVSYCQHFTIATYQV